VTAPQPSIDARDLMDASAEILASLARANNEVLALRSTWTGAASRDFGDAVREWEKHVTTVIDELDQMAAALRTGS
jgi:WXG100 family type VII secretion target